MTTLIEEGFVSFLRALPAFTAFVGADQDCRLYPAGGAPDDARSPYVTYRKVSGPRDQTHGGSSLAHPRVQLSCWSDDYLEAKRIARVIGDAVNGYRGAMGGISRAAAEVDNEVDLFVPEEKRHQVIVDVLLWHAEE